jgi:hypothetical protein
MMERGGFWLNPLEIRNIPAVKKMTAEQFGTFMQLMMDEWLVGWIEADPIELADSLNIPRINFAQIIWPRVKPLFHPAPGHPDRLISTYITDQREQRNRRVKERNLRIEKATKAGKLSGEARRARSKTRIPQVSKNHSVLNDRSTDVELELTTDNREHTFPIPQEHSNTTNPPVVESPETAVSGSASAGGDSSPDARRIGETESGDPVGLNVGSASAEFRLSPDEVGRPKRPKAPPPIRARILFEIWQQHHGGLPAVREFTRDRESKCQSRLRYARSLHREQEFIADFEVAVKRASVLPVCLGENGRDWRLDFDFLIKNDTNYLKVLEGKYDRVFSGGPPYAQRESEAEAKERRTRQAADELRAFVDRKTIGGLSCGTDESHTGRLSGGIVPISTERH